MAIGVLILGESGTGKTHSIKGFAPDEVKILSVKKPILPFRGDYELVKTPTGRDIIKELKNTKKKAIVIDDFQYVLGVQMMKRVSEKGWDKFNEIQQPYADVLEAIDELPDDVIVYLNSHVEIDENGKKKIKTIGKALDKYLTVEGLFMIVLGTLVVDGSYYFTTQNSGSDTIKSPEGMFPSYAIDNDLKYVDDKIRNYYHIGEFLTDEEMAEIDETVKHGDIPIKEEKKGRKRRGEKKKEEPAETPQEEESKAVEDSGTDSRELSPGRNSDAESKTTEEPSKRRRAKKETEEQGKLDEADNSEPVSEGQPKRRRKLSEDPERKAVAEKNANAVANNGVNDEEEAQDFEDVEMPKVEELPKRKKRAKTEEETEEEPTETPQEDEEEKPKRRRRRS